MTKNHHWGTTLDELAKRTICADLSGYGTDPERGAGHRQ
jgi:hypothetical protein